MKIKTKDGENVDIFAIYYIKGDLNFYGIPQNYKGLLAYSSLNSEVVDSNISENFIYFSKNNTTGIFHSALIKENLLEDLLELDKKAYNRFLEILKSQGEIEDDFY